MKIKNLICGALIATSLFCGIGCNQQEQKLESENNPSISSEAKVEYEISSVILQESSNSMALESQVKEWLFKNPNAEILFIDYEVDDYHSLYQNRVMIIYKIAKENKNAN